MLHLGKYSALFFLSTVKFMFAPLGGPAADLAFLETYLVCLSGALFSTTIFYFMSEFFMLRTHQKRIAKYNKAIDRGEKPKLKKNFTKVNKAIVKLKIKIGVYGVALFAPLFLSVPVGTIITAKFFGKEKKTFPLIVIGLAMNGLIITSLAYFAGGLFK